MENGESDSATVVPPLTIAAELADVMRQLTPVKAAAKLQTPVEYLLAMVELRQEFNRKVLRYLGYKRKVIYYRAD